MKFSGIAIKNFRSFDNEGIVCKDFKKINIFIGKNNSGKSNILRFINKLNKIDFPNRHNTPNDLFEELDYYTINYNKVENIGFKIFFNVDKKENDTIFGLTFEGNEAYFDLLFENGKLEIVGGIYEEFSIEQLSLILEKRAEKKISPSIGKDKIINEIHKNNCISINYSDLMGKIKLIKPFREISSGNYDEKDDSLLQGTGLVKKLNEMKEPEVGNEKDREKFHSLQSFIRDLLNDQNIELEITHQVDKLLLSANGRRLPLDSYGTGIHQIIIIAAALTIYDDHVFCIEEPEIHLHPELERKFLRYIEENTNNMYFISTHSNVFLDKGNSKDIQIYRVGYEDGKRSTVTKCETDIDTYQILSDLGCKASDLLQSNCIIWVEGPSDRYYLNKWISLKDGSLIEGIHYSVMF